MWLSGKPTLADRIGRMVVLIKYCPTARSAGEDERAPGFSAYGARSGLNYMYAALI
jgi:hypothetical protein